MEAAQRQPMVLMGIKSDCPPQLCELPDVLACQSLHECLASLREPRERTNLGIRQRLTTRQAWNPVLGVVSIVSRLF